MAEQVESGSYDLAERVTGVKRSTLHSMVHRRQIPHFRVGKRLVLFRKDDLEAWLKERRVEPNAASPALSSKGEV